MTARHTARPRGFTLLEVLAALALLAIVFTISLAAFGGAARNAHQAVALNAAVEHAQSLIAAQGLTAPLKDEQHSGTFDDGMSWTVEVRKLPGLGLSTRGGASPQIPHVNLFRVDVAVHYGDHRILQLSTERAQTTRTGQP